MSMERKLLELGIGSDSLIFFSHGYNTEPSCSCALLNAHTTLELLDPEENTTRPVADIHGIRNGEFFSI
jgi:hypothetical protein